MLSGLSIHVALKASTKEHKTTSKLVEDNGGQVTELLEADVAIAKKGSAMIKTIDEAEVPCVNSTWLRKTISQGQPLPYDSYLLGNEGNEPARSSKRSREETEESPVMKAKRTPPKKVKKKRLNVAISTGLDDSALLPIIRLLGGTVSDAKSALTEHVPLAALISDEDSMTGEAALAVICGQNVVSTEWVFASLEASEWLDVEPYLIFRSGMDRAKTEELPFRKMSILLRGRVEHPIGELCTKLIITRGGGKIADSIEKADIVVDFAGRGKRPHAPVMVQPSWLFRSAEGYELLPIDDYKIATNGEGPNKVPDPVNNDKAAQAKEKKQKDKEQKEKEKAMKEEEKKEKEERKKMEREKEKQKKEEQKRKKEEEKEEERKKKEAKKAEVEKSKKEEKRIEEEQEKEEKNNEEAVATEDEVPESSEACASSVSEDMLIDDSDIIV